MTLYHLTWESNLESILEKGLIPHYNPNGWFPTTKEKCKGMTFLCEYNKIPYWEHSLYNRMYEQPGGTGKIILLKVECKNARRDPRPMVDSTKGDWIVKTTIPVSRLKICPDELIERSYETQDPWITSSRSTEGWWPR